MVFESWNFKQRVASWTFKQRVASYFRENNKLQVDLKFFLKMNNCPNIIWLPKGRCIQFQVNQVSLGQDIQQNPILFVFQWLKIKGFPKWLLMNTHFLFYRQLDFRSEPGSCLAIFDNGLETDLTLPAKTCLNDSSWSELSFRTRISMRNQLF